jgi:predicted dienelactone hydrolase
VRLTGWLAALVACADPQTRPADPTAPVQAPDYTQPGPWSAGTAEGTVTGRDGEPLVVQWWYPTTEPGSPVTYDGLFPGEATADAPVDCSAVRPLLAFSHGSGGIRFQSTFFTEFAATHGFVVVAPDHRGNTFLDAAPDFTELVGRRPHDVEDVVDATLADDRFADCLDGDAYSVVGHSFGGYTALALAGAELVDPAGGTMSRLDPRVTAAVGLAPWDAAGTIDGGTSEIDVPHADPHRRARRDHAAAAGPRPVRPARQRRALARSVPPTPATTASRPSPACCSPATAAATSSWRSTSSKTS